MYRYVYQFLRIFPTSTLLFQPVRLFIWAIISILDQNSKLNRKLTNKIRIIRQYFGSIFPPVRLFQPVRLLIFTNFPTSTFIPTNTFIPDFRVHIQEKANHSTYRIIFAIKLMIYVCIHVDNRISDQK